MGRLALAELHRKLEINRAYIPWTPTPTQAAFLCLPVLEALYGGAAGGGKTAAMLMGSLLDVDVPGYSAILFRRTLPDHDQPGGMLDLSKQWLTGTDARWSEKRKRWDWPNGASLTFGFLEHENTKYRYQGTSFQYIGFDELTQFRESQYRYLFSRLRKPPWMRVRLRMRNGTNPGGTGHEWVRQRFLVEGPAAGRVYIPALLEDNDYIDRDAYERSLAELDYITRSQLRRGDWDMRAQGNVFRRHWFNVIDRDRVPPYKRAVRFWDLAASTKKQKRPDPDWTVGLLMLEGMHGDFYIGDVERFRGTPQEVERRIGKVARMDGRNVEVFVEQEGGSAGALFISTLARGVLRGFGVRGRRADSDKLTRALPLSAACERGEVFAVRAPWNADFFDELDPFPGATHDDQVDAASGAFSVLTGRGRGWSKQTLSKVLSHDEEGTLTKGRKGRPWQVWLQET